MKQIKVSAPGKVHFLGEHAVVYGKPAILTAVDRRCTVSLSKRNDHLFNFFSKNLNKQFSTTFRGIQEKTSQANNLWGKFISTNEVSQLKQITQTESDYPIIIAGETLKYYKISKLSNGFDLVINSEIPIGGGLGSSAALSVSMVAAVTLFLKKPFDKSVINDIAYIAEQKKHGLPSGGDNSTVCYGGLVWFRKESPELRIIQPIPFTIPDKLGQHFTLINTGQPVESTGKMVSLVRDLNKMYPKKIETFLENQEKLTRDLLAIMKNCDEEMFIHTIIEGQKNLENIGVVSNYVKTIIRKIEKSGGAAKICGAGGVTKGTGILLAYHPNNQKIQDIADSYDLNYFKTQLGVEGIKQL